jgi:hypothetical protein
LTRLLEQFEGQLGPEISSYVSPFERRQSPRFINGLEAGPEDSESDDFDSKNGCVQHQRCHKRRRRRRFCSLDVRPVDNQRKYYVKHQGPADLHSGRREQGTCQRHVEGRVVVLKMTAAI